MAPQQAEVCSRDCFARPLVKGFEENGGLGQAEKVLMRQLLGSPALVWQMTGTKKWIAVKGYVDSLQGEVLDVVC